MHRLFGSFIVVLVAFFLCSCSHENIAGKDSVKTEKSGKQVLETQKDKVSFCIGYDIGKTFVQQSIDIDSDIFLKGIKSALTGENMLMTTEEMQNTMMIFQADMKSKYMEQLKKIAEKNLKEGEEFLSKNKTREGIKVLADGLQYKVITEGSGECPKDTDTITINYKGTLIDGTEFDSSYKRGQPAKFSLIGAGVIKGWSEALPMMKVGSKWELYVPANLAYGERGAGQSIGPNSALVFEMELLSIEGTEKKIKE